MARVCAFCADPSRLITREHLFAQWVDDVLPEQVSVPNTTSTMARANEITTQFVGVPFEQTVRAVCDSCNNGWMSALEAEAGPILGPMVRHAKWTRLRPPIQRTIAAWAFKTACMLQYLHPRDRLIPDSEYHRFYVIKEPPHRVIVWLGLRGNVRDEAGMVRIFDTREQHTDHVFLGEQTTEGAVRKEADSGSRIYRIAFTLGHAVFLVIGHTFSGLYRIGIQPRLARTIVQIWPVQRAVTWPPPEPIEVVGGLQGFHDRFSGVPKSHP